MLSFFSITNLDGFCASDAARAARNILHGDSEVAQPVVAVIFAQYVRAVAVELELAAIERLVVRVSVSRAGRWAHSLRALPPRSFALTVCEV